MTNQDLLLTLKALGEETRLKIIYLLCQEELCVCELMKKLNLSQSTVSHHVKVLKQAGLLDVRKIAKWTFYSLRKEAFYSIEGLIRQEVLAPVLGSQVRLKKAPSISCN